MVGSPPPGLSAGTSFFQASPHWSQVQACERSVVSGGVGTPAFSQRSRLKYMIELLVSHGQAHSLLSTICWDLTEGSRSAMKSSLMNGVRSATSLLNTYDGTKSPRPMIRSGTSP